jgi:F0F1-type ATP synthase membrane subunit b/b'
VRNSLRQAQENFDEFSAKLKAVDVEIGALREQAKQDALLIKQKIQGDARRVAATVVADARDSAGALFSDLKGQLSSELGARVLDRAETLLRERLTGDDRARIRQEFSKQVEAIR